MTSPTPTYQWINLYPLAHDSGLVYFKALVNRATNQVAGWVTRTGSVPPYSYSIYWLDPAGQTRRSTRGTWKHADWAVQGAVTATLQAGGLGVLESLSHLPSRSLPPHIQIKELLVKPKGGTTGGTIE